MSDITRLRDALGGLIAALKYPGLLQAREQVTIKLTEEVGRRFEIWLLYNLKDEVYYHPDWYRTVDGLTPHREVILDDVKIKWPLRRLAIEYGRSIPEPLPTRVLTLQDFREHVGRPRA